MQSTALQTNTKMKNHQFPQRLLTLFNGMPVEQFLEDISLEDCPRSVANTALKNLESGRIRRILTAQGRHRPFYYVELEVSGNLERKLQISEDGTLLGRVESIRKSELPRCVQSAVTEFLVEGARFDTADHVYTSESEEFHVELDLGDDLDLHLFLDETGALLRQHEVGDF